MRQPPLLVGCFLLLWGCTTPRPHILYDPPPPPKSRSLVGTWVSPDATAAPGTSTVRFGNDGLFEGHLIVNRTRPGVNGFDGAQYGTYKLQGDVVVRQTTELTANGKVFKESDKPYRTALRWISDDRIQLTYPSGVSDTLVRQK